MEKNCLMAKSLAEVLKSSLPVCLLNRLETQRETTTQDSAGTIPWDRLPYNILVNICRHLHDKDRGHMAFVCKSWYQATKDPALWRSHVFYLYSNCEAPLGLSWLMSRAHHLRHATIMCFGSFDRYRDRFLRALQHTNLLDLDINGTAYWWAPGKGLATLSRVVARIVRLLKTQRQLVGFQMRQAMLDFTSGMGVLNALAVSSGESIVRLGLEDFFSDKIVLRLPYMPEKFTRGLMKFPNLSDLTINFEYVTDNMLYWIAQCGKNRTIHLNLVSWLTSMPTPRVSRAAWSSLATEGHDIRVYLTLQNIRLIREVIDEILMPDIPLCRLDLLGMAALGTDLVPEIIHLLRHVGQCYGQRLRGFRLWCDNDVCPEIEETLLSVLRQMPRLLYLDLHMDVQAELIGQLCAMQVSKELRLETFRMARSLSDSQEFDLFRREVKTWFQVLKGLRLDFHIRAESAPCHSAWNEYVFIIADSAGIVDSEEENNDSICHGESSRSNNLTTSLAITDSNNNNNNYSNNSSNGNNNNSNDNICNYDSFTHYNATMGTAATDNSNNNINIINNNNNSNNSNNNYNNSNTCSCNVYHHSDTITRVADRLGQNPWTDQRPNSSTGQRRRRYVMTVGEGRGVPRSVGQGRGIPWPLSRRWRWWGRMNRSAG